MKYTSNKNFNLPEYTDVIDIADINENFEAIDASLTELETSAVQPNWNQNDESAKDYVKNRTHYVEEGLVYVLEETTEEFSPEDGSAYYFRFETDHIFVADKEYTVIFDGTEYKCVSRAYSIYIHIGNGSMCGEESNTGEPFCVAITLPEYNYGEQLCRFFSDQSGEHTYSIVTVGEAVHQLDAKYLPDVAATKEFVEEYVGNAVVKADWDEDDSNSPSYILNKPFYTFLRRVLVKGFDGATVDWTDAPFNNGCFNHTESAGDWPELIDGNTYWVEWDGEEYECVCEMSEKESDSGETYEEYVIGGADNGYPFRFVKEPYYGLKIYACEEEGLSEQSTHSFALYELGEDVVKLDEKYLPDTVATKQYVEDSRVNTNWDEEDYNSPSYILNRPFYTYTERQTVSTNDGNPVAYLPLTFTDGIGNLTDFIDVGEGSLFLESGKYYYVSIDYGMTSRAYCSSRTGDDGVSYPEIEFNIESDGSTMKFSWYGEHETPYMEVEYHDSNGDPMSGTYTISVLHDAERVRPLDEKYLPYNIARVTYVDAQLATKADISHYHDDVYYTKTEIDSMELITVDDIDSICGTNIQIASEVEF